MAHLTPVKDRAGRGRVNGQFGGHAQSWRDVNLGPIMAWPDFHSKARVMTLPTDRCSCGAQVADSRGVQTKTRPHVTVIDPGWLFLAAGVALLAATVVIPAAEDAERARWQRDRAMAVEAHRQERLNRYEEYIAALEAGEPALVLALAEKQLNQIPADRALIPGRQSSAMEGASVFLSLEPGPLVLPEYHRSESMLSKWTRGGPMRVMLLACGAICVMIGLMPPSRPRFDPALVHEA